MRRGLTGMFLTLVLAAGGVPATAAPIGPAAACRGTSGVSVVVDYGRAGRPIDVRCAPGDPATGLAVLSGANLPYTFVPNQPGLVCTINGTPNPCNGAPPTAYWSYWHLRADRTWEYSGRGASSYNPAPGTTDGWAFGNGKPPRVPRPVTSAASTPSAGDQELPRVDMSGPALSRHGESS
ncbi:MAG: hypothetical protein H0T66_16385 [Geodermatophilaceae bacterium]|nr:hypothetical protein [Geodermatophilaceae bacterium]MDQ3457321.1 hypothetical protein [Actinomycetota bacterium]